MPAKVARTVYADMFGPTTGDRVRLADTDLVIEVEKSPTDRVRWILSSPTPSLSITGGS